MCLTLNRCSENACGLEEGRLEASQSQGQALDCFGGVSLKIASQEKEQILSVGIMMLMLILEGLLCV